MFEKILTKRNFGWLIAILFVGLLAMSVSIQRSTKVEITSGGFFDPKIIILDDKKVVDIGIDSAYSQEYSIRMITDDKRIDVLPAYVIWEGDDGIQITTPYNVKGDINGVNFRTIYTEKTNFVRASFWVVKLDPNIPNGEYNVQITVQSLTYPLTVYEVKNIPVYVGYK